MKSRLAILAVAALFASTPFGYVAADHGTWLGSSGSFEPNTKYDSARYMFQTPNREAVEKVYFNGIVVHSCYPLGCSYNPNVDGGSTMSYVWNYAVALLGFWRDCNRDGYIGARAAPTVYGSFSSYPRALYTVDTTICPLGSPYNPINPTTGQPDGLIDEFRWVGPSAGCDRWEAGCPGTPAHSGQRVCPANQQTVCVERYADYPGDVNGVTDNLTRVWGDWGFPGSAHVPRQGIYPMPPGTFSDSDGSLKYVDDALQQELSRSLGDTWKNKPVIGAGCAQPNPQFFLLPGGTGQCGAWPLYQVKRLHNDSTCYDENPAEGRPKGCSKADPLVRTWDYNEERRFDNPCDGGFRYEIQSDPTNGGKKSVVGFPRPKVGADSVNSRALADGSLAGTWRHQMRALNATTGKEGKCGSQPGTFESNACDVTSNLECNSQDAKFVHDIPDHAFNFTNQTASRTLAQVGFNAMPRDQFGLGGPEGIYYAGPGYFSGNVWSHRPPRLGWGATTNAYATFYADVSPYAVPAFAGQPTNNPLALASVSLPAGRQDAHLYGTEHCPGGFESGLNPANNWVCSRTAWIKERAAAGSGVRYRPVLGDPYDLRDVDCYDNTVAEKVSMAVKVGITDCRPHHK